ncbi:hypothetical protein SAMN05421743_11470 [Thalassobacillus cyri]|uniref:Pentapeptide MXKDX repeat protein n=1 Tax=Thalassobacillus cyri TaxID=571932 RepID=A0A1H4G7G2_9BACI|nr:hypothetical protein [Thalassobacillus cyri]SEB05529.1 hypothetical protein SAMN05421743_11470 [Thalassobacillus cyri]
MKIRKVPFALSFALATLLVVGTTTFAQEPDNNGMGNMMSGNGMMNMMEAMNSAEGQKMMNACGDFMEAYGETTENK